MLNVIYKLVLMGKSSAVWDVQMRIATVYPRGPLRCTVCTHVRPRPIFPLFPNFSPLFPAFSWFSPSFSRFLVNFSLSRGTLCTPLTPKWLCHWFLGNECELGESWLGIIKCLFKKRGHLKMRMKKKILKIANFCYLVVLTGVKWGTEPLTGV